LVGQKGLDGCGSGGGGGGSFIERNGSILHAAGGGGGATSDNNANNASITTSGTSDNPGVSVGGSNGNGGGTCQQQVNNGGGGGGYLGDGQNSSGTVGGWGGASFVNGGFGGYVTATTNWMGGFGGGGSSTNCTCGGGGGGGYSGGAGGQQVGYCNSGYTRTGGGGGGSLNNGTNQVNTILSAQGDGRVIITSLCNISLTTPVNPICIGASIVLTTDAASGITWSSGSTANSIGVTPTVTTSYSVTGTSTANCVASSFITVTVNPLPVVSSVTSPTTLCVGNTATITGFGASTYTWSNNASGVTTTVNPIVNTVYSVVATSAFGCVGTGTALVNVNSNSLTVNPATTLCKGKTMTLSASGAVTYTWSNGFMFASVPVSPTVSSAYSVTAIDVYNCRLNNAVFVTVVDPPVIIVSASKQVICKGESVTLSAAGAMTYTWSGGATGSSVTYTLPVDIVYHYTVTGTDASGCTGVGNTTVNVQKCVGIAELNTHGNIEALVMPNPGNSDFKLQLSQVTEHMRVEVVNELGMMVWTQNIKQPETVLDLSSESKGIYFIRIADPAGTIKVIKLIKE